MSQSTLSQSAPTPEPTAATPVPTTPPSPATTDPSSATCSPNIAAAPWVYSDLVKDHFLSPRNFLMGDESAYHYDAVGTVGNPICGDQMRMFLQIQDGRITDVKWKTYGCASAIATSSMATDLIKGKPVEDALKLTNQAVVEALDGLPAVKVHCSVLAEQAIKAALADYYKRQGIVNEALEACLACDAEHDHGGAEED